MSVCLFVGKQDLKTGVGYQDLKNKVRKTQFENRVWKTGFVNRIRKQGLENRIGECIKFELLCDCRLVKWHVNVVFTL